MSWPVAFALLASVAVGVVAGIVLDRARGRARLRRVSEGLLELARGNFAHRVILPGHDATAHLADSINAVADTIQHQQEAARARDVAQRRLLANVSHDLRTPITSIAGYVDALQRGLGDEPERYLAVIRAKIDELAQLTDDLFYSARIDAGDLELMRAPLDLSEAVRRALLGFEAQLAARDVRVDVVIPEGPWVVEADPSAIARILANLVANSLRHAEGLTRFEARMLEVEDAYLVRLLNDGARLPADIEGLFARGVAGPGGGTGLGLAIARELAGRMGASISAENTPEGLVAFTLSMPRTEFSES